MPMYEYRCPACSTEFELLVRSNTVPACPQCGATALSRLVSRLAPAGTIEAIRMANRRMADRQGHFSHLSPGERSKLLK
jgi:putative FmdB family regulatory protein